MVRLLLTLAIEVLKQLRKHYENMTPEQKAELEKAIRECKDPMGGDGMIGP